MKNINCKKTIIVILSCLLAALCLASCGTAKQKIVNTANLNLDIGIGFSHFDNESDYPAPSENAYLDVYSSKIVIRDAYPDQIIETPLIYNNSSTAYPRMQLTVSGNRMYVIYCPDISLPNLQIASTDNGGNGWIQSTLNLDTAEIGTIDNFTASFWSTKNGALILSNGMVDTFIYFTSDAGKTWQRAESAPPSQNWHDSLYKGIFLSPTIGFTTYNYYSFPPAEPQVYLTLDGSTSWNKLEIKVPDSVMESYSLAGTPFYDGEKINIPIELYDANEVLANTVYYVSYDFGETWKFYAEESTELDLIRNTAREKWFEDNRPAVLAGKEYFVSDFSLHSSFDLDENVRIDAYKLVAAYNIDDWSTVKLSGEMYFDKEANLYYKDSTGFPILLFAYEGDVFEHTYTLMGSTTEKQYSTEGESHISKRLYEEYLEHKAIKELYLEATEAYSWFTGYSTNLIGNGNSIKHEGETYTNVTNFGKLTQEITTLSQLSDYLSTLFSTELTEKMMSTNVKTSSSKELPLFLEKEDGIYRLSGYTAMFGHDAVTPKLTISSLTATDATLTVSVNEDFYGKMIEFSDDHEVFVDSDGKWKLKTFILAAEKAWKLHQGENVDKTEGAITDIDDWSDLDFSGSGSDKIKDFLIAFIYGDYEKMAELSEASDPLVFEEYANLDIVDYSIQKVYESEQSRIIFEYTIGTSPRNVSKRTESGSHKMYVTAGKKGIYLTDIEAQPLNEVGRFLRDYYSATLEYTLLDCKDLNYSQRLDITKFLAKRITGGADKEAIEGLAYIIFGVYNFEPCAELRNEFGHYEKGATDSRGLCFDIVSESELMDEIKLTVIIYADRSKLIPARSVEYSLEKNGADYRFIGAYTSETSGFKAYKIDE